ncbi:hypothetical protein HPP92_006245, partial [Vanilla planifolia]
AQRGPSSFMSLWDPWTKKGTFDPAFSDLCISHGNYLGISEAGLTPPDQFH